MDELIDAFEAGAAGTERQAGQLIVSSFCAMQPVSLAGVAPVGDRVGQFGRAIVIDAELLEEPAKSDP